MVTRQKSIFTPNKPLMNIYSGLDYEGKEVEVREDAEQLVKWHEIAEALVAAGYYRAQLQGLSAFDKIVGGLTWCIELCDIDVDISLLFEENLTIGKKIALTEKIVKVLPSMQCPYSIEPHQIQGLDFINIYPLVQWLIKYSSEFREAKEEELRKFAILQYEKDYMFDSDRITFTQEEKVMTNLSAIQNLYKPCRVRKRKGGLPPSELEQVNATLAEYDQRMLMHSKGDTTDKDEGLEFLYDCEKTLADPSEVTIDADIYKVTENTSNDDSQTKVHYSLLQSELTGDLTKELEMQEKKKHLNELQTLTTTLENFKKDMTHFKELHESRMEEAKGQYTNTINKFKVITNKLMESQGKEYSDKDVKQFYKELKSLTQERAELLKIVQGKENVHEKLATELRNLKDPNKNIEDEPLSEAELKEFEEREEKIKNYIENLRIELGKLNRDVLRYNRAIDEVPGPAELLQYEKRFMELYEQVASKHKETKQYYIFYNTLYEVKLYTTKELSLLNSILDNYEVAMSSARKREEFMSQFESIVDWVNQTVKKVDQKFKDEKDKKQALHVEYCRLLYIQRQYAAALKKLAAERQRTGRVIF